MGHQMDAVLPTVEAQSNYATVIKTAITTVTVVLTFWTLVVSNWFNTNLWYLNLKSDMPELFRHYTYWIPSHDINHADS